MAPLSDEQKALLGELLSETAKAQLLKVDEELQAKMFRPKTGKHYNCMLLIAKDVATIADDRTGRTTDACSGYCLICLCRVNMVGGNANWLTRHYNSNKHKEKLPNGAESCTDESVESAAANSENVANSDNAAATALSELAAAGTVKKRKEGSTTKAMTKKLRTSLLNLVSSSKMTAEEMASPEFVEFCAAAGYDAPPVEELYQDLNDRMTEASAKVLRVVRECQDQFHLSAAFVLAKDKTRFVSIGVSFCNENFERKSCTLGVFPAKDATKDAILGLLDTYHLPVNKLSSFITTETSLLGTIGPVEGSLCLIQQLNDLVMECLQRHFPSSSLVNMTFMDALQTLQTRAKKAGCETIPAVPASEELAAAQIEGFMTPTKHLLIKNVDITDTSAVEKLKDVAAKFVSLGCYAGLYKAKDRDLYMSFSTTSAAIVSAHEYSRSKIKVAFVDFQNLPKRFRTQQSQLPSGLLAKHVFDIVNLLSVLPRFVSTEPTIAFAINWFRSVKVDIEKLTGEQLHTTDRATFVAFKKELVASLEKLEPFNSASPFLFTVTLDPRMADMTLLTAPEKVQATETLIDQVASLAPKHSLEETEITPSVGRFLGGDTNNHPKTVTNYYFAAAKAFKNSPKYTRPGPIEWWRSQHDIFAELKKLARTWLASSSCCSSVLLNEKKTPRFCTSEDTSTATLIFINKNAEL